MTRPFDTLRAGIVVAAIAGAGALAGAAQTAAPQATADGLAPLTSEVRALRLAVERAGHVQSEVQALGVALSAQQSRLVQLSRQLETVRRDLGAADAQAGHFDGLLKQAQSDPNAADADTGFLTLIKGQADQARRQAENLRGHELRLYQQIQDEEARWNDLIGRLDAATKR